MSMFLPSDFPNLREITLIHRCGDFTPNFVVILPGPPDAYDQSTTADKQSSPVTLTRLFEEGVLSKEGFDCQVIREVAQALSVKEWRRAMALFLGTGTVHFCISAVREDPGDCGLMSVLEPRTIDARHSVTIVDGVCVPDDGKYCDVRIPGPRYGAPPCSRLRRTDMP